MNVIIRHSETPPFDLPYRGIAGVYTLRMLLSDVALQAHRRRLAYLLDDPRRRARRIRQGEQLSA